MKKSYIRPDLNVCKIESKDIITVSDAAMEDIIKNITVANAKTESYDFTEFFGE